VHVFVVRESNISNASSGIDVQVLYDVRLIPALNVYCSRMS